MNAFGSTFCKEIFDDLTTMDRGSLPDNEELAWYLAQEHLQCTTSGPLIEALRTLFLEDLLARPLVKEEQPGGLWDRVGNQ
jgi:hypothetical protein